MKLSSYASERASFFIFVSLFSSQTHLPQPFVLFVPSISSSSLLSFLVTTSAFLCIISVLRITGVTAVICVQSCSSEIFFGQEKNISRATVTLENCLFLLPPTLLNETLSEIGEIFKVLRNMSS